MALRLIPLEELRIERFRETLDVRTFDCEDRELNDFLTTKEVAKYEREGLGKTHLVYWQPEGKLVAYFTISFESLRLNYLKSVKSFSIPGEIRVESIPGIKIGRLAVEKSFKRRGIGAHILRYIAGLAIQAPAAARILFVEAYPESVEFYENFEFIRVEHHRFKRRRTILMYFDLRRLPEWPGSA
ncbi:MAG TPA: GNAT family N-acetyltransferase [Thermoplasmata archaeon]|nr:GNAT family N-acetyltransferase [Thermoplasmata archaeon]